MGFMSDMFKGSGGSLVGGTLGAVAGFVNQHSANSHNMAMANMNAKLQREFAQNSIRWRVEDAKRAGVHPMAALGISPASFSPVSAPFTSNGLEDMLATMGQNVDRAALAAKSAEDQQAAKDFDDKFNALRLRNMELQNDALLADIESKNARTRQMNVPPAPSTKITTPFGDQPDAPYTHPYGKALYNLFVVARHGDTFVEVPHPDIADGLTESAWKNILTSIDAEYQAESGVIKPPYYLLTPEERKAVKEYRYEFVRVPGEGWKLDRNPTRLHPYDKLSKYEKFRRKSSQKWSDGRKAVSGKIF